MKNENLRIRFTLRDRETKQIVIISPKIYDEMSGLLQFPIEVRVWEVLKMERSTELHDITQQEIFEGDKVEFNPQINESSDVTFEDGAYRINGAVLTAEFIRKHQVQIVS